MLEDRLAPATINYVGASGNWNDSANWSGGVVPTCNDEAVFNNASGVVNVTVADAGTQVQKISFTSGFTLTITGDLTVEELQLGGGTITGPGTLYVLNSLAWTAGTMSGSGTTRILSSATADIALTATTGAAAPLADSRTLLNLGTTTWNGPFAIPATALVNNQKTFTFRNGDYTLDASSRITNTDTLVFNSSNVTFNGPLTLNSSITILHADGEDDKSVTINGDVSIRTLTLRENLTGPGTLTVTGTFAWEGGKLAGTVLAGQTNPTGSTIIPVGATFDLPTITDSRRLAGRTLTVLGQRTWVVQNVTGALPPGARLLPPVVGPVMNQYSSILAWTDAVYSSPDLPLDNKRVLPQAVASVPLGPITIEQADALAHQIYDAMYGGNFGAGTNTDAVFRALEGRTRADVELIEDAYRLRYTPIGGAPREMEPDLRGQSAFAPGLDNLKRLEELLAGNQVGAQAVTLRQMLGKVSSDDILALREFLLLADIGALSPEYARLYPAGSALTLMEGAASPDASLPRIQFDVMVTLNNAEKLRQVDNASSSRSPEERTAYVDEILDYRRSLELLFQGNRVASEAVAVHGLFAGVNSILVAAGPRERLVRFFETRTKEQLAEIDVEFTQRYSQAMAAAFPPYLGANYGAILTTLMTGTRFDRLAQVLRRAFDQDNDGTTDDLLGDGTDEDAVWNILDGLYADERAMLVQVYRQHYSKTVMREITDEFSDNVFDGPERNKTLKLYSHGGLSPAERVFFATEGLGTDEDSILRASREFRQMTPEQIAAANEEYGQLAPNWTLRQAFEWDLTGSSELDAVLSLEGRITTVEQFYQLALRRYNYERVGASNWVGNFLGGINTQGENLEAAWSRLQTAYNAVPQANRNDPIDNYPDFRREVRFFDNPLQAYRGFRSAAAEVACNGLATIAGIAAFALTGGAIAPLVVAFAAGATTQAAANMAVNGYFDWEELPSNLLQGGTNGVLAGLSLAQAPAAAGTRFYVLRAIAANPFANGAFATGLNTAMREDTWGQGSFSVGMATVAQSALLGGLGAAALARVPGATVSFARATGLTTMTRTIATEAGREVVQIYKATFQRLIREAIATGKTWTQAMTDALPNFIARVDAISQRLFDATASDSVVTIRQWVRNLLANDNWGGPQVGFAGEGVVGVWESARAEFPTLGVQGIKDRLLNSMQSMYMTFPNVVDDLIGRMTGAQVPNATRELAEELAERLATITDDITDDAVIRARITEAIQVVAPAQVGNQQLMTTVRNLLVVRSLSGASPALRALGEQFANRAKQLYATLTAEEMRHTTIAVSRIRVDGQWIEVVAVNRGAPQSVIDKIRPAVEGQGGIFRRASGSGARGHAEAFLYREFRLRDGFEVIGISHKDGPCADCLPILRDAQFSNVFWDYTRVLPGQ